MRKPKRNTQIKVAVDDWFAKNYQALKESISMASAFDEDAFHEAYLILISKSDIQPIMAEFRALFLTTYKAITKRQFNESYLLCHPDELFFTLLPDSLNDDEPAQDSGKLAKTIASYIQCTFNELQKAVWNMRLQGYSIVNTADALGIKASQVNEEYQSVKSKTKASFAMAL